MMPDLFGDEKTKAVRVKCSQCGRFIPRADMEDGSAVFYNSKPAWDSWTCAECVGANEELGQRVGRHE